MGRITPQTLPPGSVEMTILVLICLAIGVWIAVSKLKLILNKHVILKPQRLTMNDVGLSPEQTIRFCALARAKGISQQTLWRLAALRMLEEDTQ